MIDHGVILAATSLRTHFEFGRDLSTPWHWILPAAVLVLLAWFVVAIYLRDCVELGGRRAAVLIALRLLAFLGLLVVYLQPQWRSTHDVIDPSRVLVLVDTSQSMGRQDVPAAGGTAAEGRLQRIVREFREGELLTDLRKIHDVVVYRFDSDDAPTSIASLPRRASSAAAPDAAGDHAAGDHAAEDHAAEDIVAWEAVLAAGGEDTKIGEALEKLVAYSRGGPVAGIILLSDGQQTAGIELEKAIEEIRAAEIPVMTVGLGSIETPEYVRLADFSAPQQAYPNDPFMVTAYLQAEGLAGRRATVRLRQLPGGASDANTEDGNATDGNPTAGAIPFEDQVDILLGTGRDEVLPVTFEVDGIHAPGRYIFELDVALRGGLPSDDEDARRRFYIDVSAKRTRVLLLAGGPSREYQFLHNLLRRDEKNIELDLLLQSRQHARINDAAYLTEFPDRDQLLEYDVLIAIDPDWNQLGPSQVAMIEEWVGDEAGGLILMPGIVNAGSIVQSWIHDPDYQRLRDLYPVKFYEDFEIFDDWGQQTSSVRGLEFTRDGIDAGFLQLDDNPLASQRVWTEFEGVYGPRPVKGKKLGATVYARYEDDLAESIGQEPIFFAGQFYGKGRVFYQASGEMWRLRRLDAAYFEKWYTHLIRHVSTGRLHRGSARGDVLLVEKESYHLGDTIPIVAQLKNAQRNPYQAESVTMYVFDSDGTGIPVELRADRMRKGMFRGEFVPQQPEDYHLQLQLPESEGDPLSKVIKVTTSDREKKHPEQDEQALKHLAAATGGRYFASIEAAGGHAGDPPLAAALVDQTRVTPVAGDIDPVWNKDFSRWMLVLICGVLSLEWLLRRLFRLA